ncbi:ABC1 kinase family protein [Craterilacuibacter sp.]|uniref:ABC1 kinase family protein n=1 Tax=Craterilacuibacter sp. TaxID=2870909 RepID=UPI003F2D2F3C
MLRETLLAMRDLPRLREITAILVHHGLGRFAERLGLSSAMAQVAKLFSHTQVEAAASIPTPVRLRLAFEELGPTFIKLGQILSTRVDVFPPEWIAEFEKLQNRVPPIAASQVKALVSKALGRPLDEVFDDFEVEPIGAASIAQVHKARLKDGTVVAIKLRRPHIVAKVEADLRILDHLAYLIEMEFPETRHYQAREIVAQFARSLKRELDLAAEGRSMDRFARDFREDPYIVVPRVHWDYSNSEINVQDYIAGIAGGRLELLAAAGLDAGLLARRGADAVLKMILINGFFHADPHPGNVFYLADNRIAFIDFGMVGRLSHVRRDEIVDLLSALARRDERAMSDALIEWTGRNPVDEQRFAYDVSELMFQYEHVPLGQLNISQLIIDIMALIRDHHIVLPADLAMLFKALITLEGLGRQLDPDFYLVDQLTPFVHTLIKARYHPKALAQKGRQSLSDGIAMLAGLPHDLIRMARDVRQGKFRINLDLARLDNFGRQIDKSSNRLTMGIVTGCLIIGSSIVMTVNAGPMLFGLPLFGFLGFMVAMLNSLWLIFSIWRAGKEY